MINIILADDHAIVRRGLHLMFLEVPDIRVVAEVGTGTEVLTLLNGANTVDVVLADVMMPDINGLELAEQIYLKYPQVAVLMLTVKDDDDCLRYAFNAGIQGYLLKTTDMEELVFAIRQAVRKKPYLSADLARKLMNRMVAVHESDERLKASKMEFSTREMEILLLIAEGLTNQQAADKLFTSKRTIEGHRQALLIKTGTSNAAQLIRFAMRAGILD